MMLGQDFGKAFLEKLGLTPLLEVTNITFTVRIDDLVRVELDCLLTEDQARAVLETLDTTAGRVHVEIVPLLPKAQAPSVTLNITGVQDAASFKSSRDAMQQDIKEGIEAALHATPERRDETPTHAVFIDKEVGYVVGEYIVKETPAP